MNEVQLIFFDVAMRFEVGGGIGDPEDLLHALDDEARARDRRDERLRHGEPLLENRAARTV